MNEKFKSIASTSAGILPDTKTSEQRFFAAYPVIIGSRLFIYRAPPKTAAGCPVRGARTVLRSGQGVQGAWAGGLVGGDGGFLGQDVA